MGPLLLLCFGLLKFFTLILLEQGPLLDTLSVSWSTVVLPRQCWGKVEIPDIGKVGGGGVPSQPAACLIWH